MTTQMNTFLNKHNIKPKKIVENKPVGNSVLLTLLIIIILIIVAVIVYKHFKSYNTIESRISNTYIRNIYDAKVESSYAVSKLMGGNEYNYNVWIYISNYKYRNGEDKCILYKGKPNSALDNVEQNIQSSPGVWLLRSNNTLRIKMGLETNINELDSSECDIENFPLQTWVNLNVSLIDNVVDVYINGQLLKSCLLSGSPVINTDDILVCPNGGFAGFIANLQVSSRAYNAHKTNEVYRKGPVLQEGLIDNIINSIRINL
jgi:hypothetical protein